VINVLSLRSPWTNTYNPPLSDGALPSKKLRELEIAMNDAFDTYRDMSVRSSGSTQYGLNILYVQVL
jgi:capping protein beta